MITGEAGPWVPVPAGALAGTVNAPPPAGTVHVWAIPTETAAELPRWTDALPRPALHLLRSAPTPQRREHRLTWLGAEWILARYVGCAPEALQLAARGSGRKPHLDPAAHPESGIKFNLSHSGGWSLLAVSAEREVGIDLERERIFREPLNFAKRFLHPLECAHIAAQPDQERSEALRRLWVRKEAAAKATGFGLPLGLASFSALAGEGGPEHWQELTLLKARVESPCSWTLRGIPAPPKLVAALCVEGAAPGPEVHFHELR